jgi:hypothetical protein
LTVSELFCLLVMHLEQFTQQQLLLLLHLISARSSTVLRFWLKAHLLVALKFQIIRTGARTGTSSRTQNSRFT